MLKASSVRMGCFRALPAKCWITPRTETPPPLWAASSVLDHPPNDEKEHDLLGIAQFRFVPWQDERQQTQSGSHFSVPSQYVAVDSSRIILLQAGQPWFISISPEREHRRLLLCPDHLWSSIDLLRECLGEPSAGCGVPYSVSQGAKGQE